MIKNNSIMFEEEPNVENFDLNDVQYICDFCQKHLEDKHSGVIEKYIK